MKRMRIGTALLLAGFLAACGGSGGGSADTATLTGTIGQGAGRVAARAAAAAGADEFYVEAVDEAGTVQDTAQGLRTGDTFELHVPAGHTYVIVVGDASGPLGGAVYDPAEGRADFEVPAGVTRIELGTLEVDPSRREVAMGGGDPLTPPQVGTPADNDCDHIPDFADEDDDNDGVADARDPHPYDHDNDKLDDIHDEDDDNDGLADAEDDHPRDHDDDGVDDDRAMGAMGDASVGAQKYAEAGCAACHGEDGSGGGESIRNTPARELAEVLLKGEGEGEDHEEAGEHDDDEEHEGAGGSMPAFPGLVPYAPDLAAFLSGDAPADTGAQNPPADTGGQTPPADTGTQNPPADTGTGSQPPVSRPAALDSTCLMCHGDNSAKVSCGNTKWLAHDGGRVSATIFDQVSAWATGGTCP